MNVKKLLLTIILTFLAFFEASSYAKISTAAYVRGYWTKWDVRNYEVRHDYAANHYYQDFELMMHEVGGTFSNMQIRKAGCQPWNWCFKFEVDNYVKPDKKTRKQHLKDQTWYVYTGWVEYYVSDEFPTISKVLEYYEFPLIEPTGDTARAKRRARATIKIAPYKKAPECFNIFFDDVGVAISFSECPFDKSYFVR